MNLVLILIGVIAFIVLATSKFKLHPFLTLILAAFIAAFAYGLPSSTIAKTITSGFGGILGYIGLVIVLGTIIGTILEKSGAAITMANCVIKLLGKRFPTLTMSLIGYIVSIPVFCDSGFVILNSLKQSMANRMKVSSVSMSVALATGTVRDTYLCTANARPYCRRRKFRSRVKFRLGYLSGLFLSLLLRL